MSTAKRSLSMRLDDHAGQPNVELGIGGRLRFDQPQFTENRAAGETATPADPIMRETDALAGYLTVHYQNGNYEWFEFNFRVRDGVAYLGSKVKLDRPRNGRGWIPPAVRDAIHEHHPELEVRDEAPPWWSE